MFHPENHYGPEQTFSSTFFWRNETVVFFWRKRIRGNSGGPVCAIFDTLQLLATSYFYFFVTQATDFTSELLAYITKEEVNVKYTSAFVPESLVNVPLSSDYIIKSSVNVTQALEFVPLTEVNVTDALVSVPLTEVFVTLPEKYFT
jgi:hypothetical protein